MIKAILTCYNSKRDGNGNCYFAFIWTDTRTARQTSGQVCGGKSNVRSIIRTMGLTWKEVHFTTVELAIREFDRMVKDWKYAGCEPDELAAFIEESNDND